MRAGTDALRTPLDALHAPCNLVGTAVISTADPEGSNMAVQSQPFSGVQVVVVDDSPPEPIPAPYAPRTPVLLPAHVETLMWASYA